MVDGVINKVMSKDGYDKEAYKKRKKEQKDEAYKIIDEAFEELKTNSTFFKEYLDVQSRFNMYSPRNALLITKQMPNAMQLKTRNDWKKLNITFKSPKQKTITIIEPGESYIDKSGDSITPINAKEVIDISETNSKPNIKSYDKQFVLQALLHEPIITIKAVDNLSSGKMCEWNLEEDKIFIRRGNDYEETIKALTHELANVTLFKNANEFNSDKAECISYMICKRYGINSTIEQESIDNLCSKYSKMENIKIAKDLTTLRDTALEINNKMEQYLDGIKKDTKNKEQER